MVTIDIQEYKTFSESRRYGVVSAGPGVVSPVPAPLCEGFPTGLKTTMRSVLRSSGRPAERVPAGEIMVSSSGDALHAMTPPSVSRSQSPEGEKGRSGPAPFTLASHVEDIKLVDMHPPAQCDDDPFFDFPSRGLAKFRSRLLRSREFYEGEEAGEQVLWNLESCSDSLERLVLSGEIGVERLSDAGSVSSGGYVREVESTSLPLSNSFCVLEEEGDLSCSRQLAYRRKAKALVRHLRVEWGIKPLRDLPSEISCGELRSKLRSIFPASLPEEVELSIKTAQKVETSCCRSCEPRFAGVLEEYKEARFRPVSIDDAHLARFVRAFRMNVERGWNRRKHPYIPNGNATLWHSRSKGGNWQEEEFSAACRPALVFSSGKPRVVTLYSAHNTSVLTPLHLSLYAELKRKGWLLVGPPSEEAVAGLNGEGEFLSFDYVGATDNLKSAYVRAALEVLIDRAWDLTDDEVRCLRVLGELRFSEDGPSATVGQPMGSVMSFPLLCLFNKTVVDMALADQLERGEITWKEFQAHRCLINGDDLLLREVHSSCESTYLGIQDHGLAVGFLVNKEKSMRDKRKAEINSTLFKDGVKEKKSNISALFMVPDNRDVLGFANESARTDEGFKRLVRANARLLALQEVKGLDKLPYQRQAICRKDRKIRKALLSEPTVPRVPDGRNFFPIEDKPPGFVLSREKQVIVINERVKKVREAALERVKKDIRSDRAHRFVRPSGRSWRSLLRESRTTPAEEKILCCLADAWRAEEKDALVKSDDMAIVDRGVIPPSDLPIGFALIDFIRSRKGKSSRCAEPIQCRMEIVVDETEDWGDPLFDGFVFGIYN
jgi:hypothetical protein